MSDTKAANRLERRLFAVVAVLAFMMLNALTTFAATTVEVFIRPNPGDMPIYESLKEAFEKSHPDITVKYLSSSFGEYWEKIPVLYAGGTAPDVIFPSTSKTIEYALAGMLMPLDDYVESDGFDLSGYFQPILAQYRLDGKLYALPNDLAAMAYVYNANMFAAAGIVPPELGWSAETYKAILKKLTVKSADGTITRFGSAWPATNPLIWSSLGSNFFDDELWPTKFLLDSPRGYEGLQFIQDLQFADHVLPQPGESANFLAGTAAMATIGHWTLPQIIENASFDWDLTSFPVLRYPVQRSDGSGWSIMKSTERPQAAWSFVKFAGGPEGQRFFARNQFVTPAHEDVAFSSIWRDVPGHPEVSKDAFIFGLEYSFNNYILTNPRVSEFMNLIGPATQKVFANEASPELALDSIAGPIDELLAEVAEAKRQHDAE